MSLPIDRADIERALRESKDETGEQNIGKAARALRMSRRTLQNRMRAFGMAVGKAGRRHKKFSYRKHRYLAPVLGGAAAIVLGAVAVSKLGSKA